MALITISQDYASGGYIIASIVANTLGIEFYDDERIKKNAIDRGVKPENLAGLEEKVPGFFDRLLHIHPQVYLDVLQGEVYKIAEKSNALIFGHGSQVLLQDFECALHIRIFAPLETRIENAMSKRGIDRQHAEKVIRSKDEQFNGFFKYAFKRDNKDLSLYDLIINTDKIGYEIAAKQIVELVHSGGVESCNLEALDTMHKLALEKKVHAKLLSVGISPNMVNINAPEPGFIVLGGFVNDADEKLIAVQTALDLPGVARVEDNILLRSDLNL